ncbi:hypothetical protein ACRRTK_000016 [Alexandromys fortis]
MVVKALPPPVTFAIAIILFESTHEAKGSGWHYTFFREACLLERILWWLRDSSGLPLCVTVTGYCSWLNECAPSCAEKEPWSCHSPLNMVSRKDGDSQVTSSGSLPALLSYSSCLKIEHREKGESSQRDHCPDSILQGWLPTLYTGLQFLGNPKTRRSSELHLPGDQERLIVADLKFVTSIAHVRCITCEEAGKMTILHDLTSLRLNDRRARLSTVRAQPEYSQSTARVQSEHSQSTVRAQPEYSQSTARVQSEHSQSTARVQSEHSQSTVRAQPEYSQSTARVQSEHSQSTVRAQPEYSQSTARVQSSLPSAVRAVFAWLFDLGPGYWVKIHHLEYTDGGILDPDDVLADVVEDKDKYLVIAMMIKSRKKRCQDVPGTARVTQKLPGSSGPSMCDTEHEDPGKAAFMEKSSTVMWEARVAGQAEGNGDESRCLRFESQQQGTRRSVLSEMVQWVLTDHGHGSRVGVLGNPSVPEAGTQVMSAVGEEEKVMGVCQQARRAQNTELHQVYLQLLDLRPQVHWFTHMCPVLMSGQENDITKAHLGCGKWTKWSSYDMVPLGYKLIMEEVALNPQSTLIKKTLDKDSGNM